MTSCKKWTETKLTSDSDGQQQGLLQGPFRSCWVQLLKQFLGSRRQENRFFLERKTQIRNCCSYDRFCFEGHLDRGGFNYSLTNRKPSISHRVFLQLPATNETVNMFRKQPIQSKARFFKVRRCYWQSA